MNHAILQGLRSIFQPIVLATAACLAAPAASDGLPGQGDSLRHILQKRELGFKQYGLPFGRLRPALHARAMHIEESLISIYSTSWASRRHAETAAYAMAYAAVSASGRDIPVELYDATPFIGVVPLHDTSQQHESAILNQYALDHATVISTSTNITESRTEIQHADFEKHRQAWRKSKAIMVQSAGNAGSYCKAAEAGPSHQQEFSTFQFADSYIRVGSAKRDHSGRPVINRNSSCTAADIIALNPYEQGLSYRYRVSLSEFQERVNYYTDDPQDRERVSDTQRASAMLKNIRNDSDPGGHLMTNISGNSFIAPPVGGYIAAAYEACPRLSEYDLLAAAFARAVPVTNSEDGIVPHYKSNGRVPFDDDRVGFGYLDAEDYNHTVKEICEFQGRNPHLKTVEKHVLADGRTLRPQPDAGNIPEDMKAYAIDVGDEAFAFRMMLEINLRDDSRNPFSMQIRNPLGVSYDFRPGVRPGIGKGLALVSTNGFFGNNTRGTWLLIVDKDVNIDYVDMRFSGVKRGGLADEIVDRYGVKEPLKVVFPSVKPVP